MNPGDRASNCRGIMRPIATEYLRGEFSIIYICDKCGARHRVRAAQNDNRELLIAMASKARPSGSYPKDIPLSRYGKIG